MEEQHAGVLEVLEEARVAAEVAHAKAVHPQPCTLNPSPSTIPPSPSILHSLPPTCHTLHPTPHTPHLPNATPHNSLIEEARVAAEVAHAAAVSYPLLRSPLPFPRTPTRPLQPHTLSLQPPQPKTLNPLHHTR
jgi:hypothetical protein